MSLYSLQDITKTYQERAVLDIDRLDIEPGRIYALLGPNGAGKTTLLNILSFLETPTKGTLFYSDAQVQFSEPKLQALRRQVVMQDQFPILFSTSVYKNIEFGLKVRKVEPGRRRRRIEEALELVGMTAFANHPAYKLSGGETQRVALARALALKPKVFLCDEPTASVDVENRSIVLGALKSINQEQKITIIFATHDRALAADLAHTTLMLNRGRLIDTDYENIFAGRLHTDGRNHRQLVFDTQLSLTVSPTATWPELNRVRISVDAGQVVLCPPAVMNNGVRNRLRGRVKQVAQERDQIRLLVDIGIVLVLKLPAPQYQSHPLVVGQSVELLIPPEAIRPV